MIVIEYGGFEFVLFYLLILMLYQGMIIIGLLGNFVDNVLYGFYYGVGVICLVDSDVLLSD